MVKLKLQHDNKMIEVPLCSGDVQPFGTAKSAKSVIGQDFQFAIGQDGELIDDWQSYLEKHHLEAAPPCVFESLNVFPSFRYVSPNSEHEHCSVCHTVFDLSNRRHSCKSCDNVCCRSCVAIDDSANSDDSHCLLVSLSLSKYTPLLPDLLLLHRQPSLTPRAGCQASQHTARMVRTACKVPPSSTALRACEQHL